MTVLTMNPTLGDLLKWEDNPNFSREVGVLAQSAAYLLGTVLGKARGSGTVTVAAGVADAGNTGNGTLTLAGTPYTASVKEGTYVIVFTSATKYEVEDPGGHIIGTGTVGAAFSKDLAFTIAAGGTAFVAGDRWTVAASVAGNSGKLYQWDPAATDGSESIAGVLLFDTDATAADKTVVYLRREALVSQAALIWKSGLTAAQISDGLEALARLGIQYRTTA